MDSLNDDYSSWLRRTLHMIARGRLPAPDGDTVNTLAREVGMSRSGISKRFMRLVRQTGKRYRIHARS